MTNFVQIIVADTNLTIGETTTVTFILHAQNGSTWGEAFSNYSDSDIELSQDLLGPSKFTVENGSLSNFQKHIAPNGLNCNYTATLTASANINDTTNVIQFDDRRIYDFNYSTTGTGFSTSNNYAIDTARPTASIIVADTALKAGETSLVTFTFSEAVTGFTNADLVIANGTLSPVSSFDGGITWTATFTPSANISDTTNLITLDNTGIADLSGNTGTGTTISNNYVIDTVRPTATIIVADTALKAGETSLVTITFSEAVTGFTNADLSIANGTLSPVSSFDGGITWTATITPSANISDTTNLITLDNTGIADLSANTGTGTTISNNYSVDTAGPTATIIVADTALKAGETSLVTITFSEAVTGFTNADLSIANGTLSSVSSADGGITWTATFTPSANITDTTNLITLDNAGVQNSAGNTGAGATSSNNYVIDTVRPTATIIVADTALKAGETSLVTITFSEAVSGFTNADLTIDNGTLSAISSNDGGITWTATFTPSANISDTTNLITLDNTGIADLSGNTGTGTTISNNYAIDTVRPTATIILADTALKAGETSLVTITFSEAVAGFTLADLTIESGILSSVSSADGGITWTATLTPSANTTDATNIITLDNTGIMDAFGNSGTGTTASNNYTIDTARPTATIAVADANLTIGETSLVTFTFSEAVTGFTNADLTIDNGTLSAVSSSDGGITWTATLTPSANITDATNAITLDNSGVTDAAGNTGAGTSSSNNYAINMMRPTATITVADTALRIGEMSLVTIAFSEAVSGFTTADLTIDNGTLSAVSSADGGITWTATFTPSANITDTTNAITLDNSGVQNGAGNTGVGTTSSNNYGIDTERPTATITVADANLTAGETSLVTFTFSEAVTGFTNADLTSENGTLSALSSSDGGITWTARLTPTANMTDATNLIMLDNMGISDLAGNSGQGSTHSNNYALDTVVRDIVGTATNNRLIGTNTNETIWGKQGNDVIFGNGGNDRIIGGTGADRMTGGAGRDVFVFENKSDSAPGATGIINNGRYDPVSGAGKRDVITDFMHGVDKIDLSAIDANLRGAGDQAFKFIGTSNFNSAPGGLSYKTYNFAGTAYDKTIIYGDINGDRMADFQIELSGIKKLSVGDFIL